MVEAGALEDNAHGVEQLAELAAALLADGQRIVTERLANIELVSTCGAAIRIGRQASSFRCYLSDSYPSDWHSKLSSANSTRRNLPRPDSLAASWQDHIFGTALGDGVVFQELASHPAVRKNDVMYGPIHWILRERNVHKLLGIHHGPHLGGGADLLEDSVIPAATLPDAATLPIDEGRGHEKYADLGKNI